MNYPTHEEIRLSYDAITADGEMSEVTVNLCAIVLEDPLLRNKAERLAGVLSTMTAGGAQAAGPTGIAFIASCIASGLNHGIRIADMRLAGMKKRSAVEDLLRHMRDGQCAGASSSPECTAESIKVLERVLGNGK
jgi:hypothetical protein